MDLYNTNNKRNAFMQFIVIYTDDAKSHGLTLALGGNGTKLHLKKYVTLSAKAVTGRRCRIAKRLIPLIL